MDHPTIFNPKTKYSCSCKGIRTCAICISEGKSDPLSRKDVNQNNQNLPILNLSDKEIYNQFYPNIIILRDFINIDEESLLLENFKNLSFTDSQSGRKKVDFGVKVNFKKRKVKLPANFKGFPKFCQPIVEKFKNPDLKNYIQEEYDPHELLILEYDPERGAHIDPHVDDSWAWGETIANLNLLSSAVLTLKSESINSSFILPIKLNRRDLVMLRGEQRHVWTHEIKAEDITSLRYCITFRNFSEQVKEGFPEIWSRFKEGVGYF